MDTPKISVIIPVYNAEKYLEKCLDSILQQTFREIEVICVDDGSQDASKQILRRYASQDARVIVVEQKNMYAGVARNRGMELAKGKYLIFLDADDFFHPDMLRRAYACSEQYRADITIFNVKCFSDQTKITFKGKWLYNKDLIPQKQPFSMHDIYSQIFQITTASPWNKLFNREFIQREQILFQGTRSTNDVYFVNLALALAERIVTIDRSLLYYRVDTKNNLQNTQEQSPLDFYTACRALKKSLEQRKAFQNVEQSFVNFALSCTMNALRKVKNEESFRDICECFRREIAMELGIHSHIEDRDYFYNDEDYRILIHLCNASIPSNKDSIFNLTGSNNLDKKPLPGLRKWRGILLCFYHHGLFYTLNEVLKTLKNRLG